MKNIYILLGPQGSGKSTQGKKIQETYNMEYIIMSDLLKKESKKKTKLAKEISKIMKNGDFVPPETSSHLMIEKIKKSKKRNILIDGFPRELAQMHILDYYIYITKNIEIKNVIYIDLNKKECIKRMLLRKRYDDTKKAIKHRLNFYYKETNPVLEEYDKRKKLIKINGKQEIEDVFKEIKNKLKNKIK